MGIRPEVFPFLCVAGAIGVALALVIRGVRRAAWSRCVLAGAIVAAILGGYLAYFFRDPDRMAPVAKDVVVAAADGRIAGIVELDDSGFAEAAARSGLSGAALDRFLGGGVIRISIFLSLFDVHVNRSPMTGLADFLGYFPGRHFFTFKEKSSEHNQHNAILIRNGQTCCLVNQIVGPVCRRVVYWPDHDRPVKLRVGDRIGMMKFGSRLDMYFPKDDVDLRVQEGDRVRAGETIVAGLQKGAGT